MKKVRHDCIDAKHVPCPKARDYLKKHGRLCGVHPDDMPAHTQKPKRKPKKNWLARLLGF